ncbi:hypothetical protein P5673_022660 [Acropora cervicornis]|uniref:Uncharacterized protein n=1 Tax=Acropora cervicornis TaxID=6130 RepID=A0AAD9Q6E5_ACRCE|nr:hypothetical protein P5673_022660 [Acropora cervicornis]
MKDINLLGIARSKKPGSDYPQPQHHIIQACLATIGVLIFKRMMIHSNLLQKPFQASLSYVFGDNGQENDCIFFLLVADVANADTANEPHRYDNALPHWTFKVIGLFHLRQEILDST